MIIVCRTNMVVWRIDLWVAFTVNQLISNVRDPDVHVMIMWWGACHEQPRLIDVKVHLTYRYYSKNIFPLLVLRMTSYVFNIFVMVEVFQLYVWMCINSILKNKNLAESIGFIKQMLGCCWSRGEGFNLTRHHPRLIAVASYCNAKQCAKPSNYCKK